MVIMLNAFPPHSFPPPLPPPLLHCPHYRWQQVLNSPWCSHTSMGCNQAAQTQKAAGQTHRDQLSPAATSSYILVCSQGYPHISISIPHPWHPADSPQLFEPQQQPTQKHHIHAALLSGPLRAQTHSWAMQNIVTERATKDMGRAGCGPIGRHKHCCTQQL